jgi:hypothetical protein
MSDLPDETVQSSQIAEELKPSILKKLDTSQKAIEELSDEELEVATGGFALSMTKNILKWGFIGADIGTIGGAVTHQGAKIP